jgi:uncharacterized protein
VNILIDIGHPAHIHYFKNLSEILKSHGDKVFFSAKDTPSIVKLLNNLGYDYFLLPPKTDGLVSKAVMQLRYDWLLYKFCKQHKIDCALGVSVTITHISRISNIVSILFDDDDDDVQPYLVKWAHPFATELISPYCLKGKQKRQDAIYYPGYHELAYLHPNRFDFNESILPEAGLKKEEPFFILRFNAFKAHHDAGIKGLSKDQKHELINELKSKGRIFITSERELPREFEQYRLTIDPVKIHSLMYYATLFIGDSQTMAAEAAVLGVPSIRCNSFAGRISTLEELEKKYGLTYAYLPNEFDKMMHKIRELLLTQDLKEEWEKRKLKMLSDKIDVTAFWVWFIGNYPKSKSMDSDYKEFFNQFK